MKKEFLMCCTRDQVGTSACWHAKDGRGYTTNIGKAHVYTREEAQADWRRAIDVPVSLSHVLALSYRAVDMQYVTSCCEHEQKPTLYVKERTYDGNNLKFFTSSGVTADLDAAKKANSKPRMPHEVYLLSDLEKAARSVFKWSLYNPKTMTQGAGLVVPGHIKKERRRKTSPLYRYNCDYCGRFFYSHSSHEDVCDNC